MVAHARMPSKRDLGARVTKRDLGVGYLIGLGLGVFSVLVGRSLLVSRASLDVLGITFTGLLLAACFVFVGYQLLQSELPDDHIWRVAQWGAVGLLAPTLLFALLAVFVTDVARVQPGLYVINFLAGGIAGVLFGSVIELQRENVEVHRLNQRNGVLYRILRHNLRNSLNVIAGRANLLESEFGPDARPHTATIHQEADHLVDLSSAARRSEQVEGQTDVHAVDVAAAVTHGVDSVTGAAENADRPGIDVDVPAEARAFANHRLSDVLETLLQHGIDAVDDADASIALSVDASRRTVQIILDVPDDGRLHEKLRILASERETQFDHLDGVDLWAAKWLVSEYDGTLTSRVRAGSGSSVRLELWRAESVVDYLGYHWASLLH